MADAQLTEEELQQSVMQSEREAELAREKADGDVAMGDNGAAASRSQIDVGEAAVDEVEDQEMDDEEERRQEHEDDHENGSQDGQSDSGGSEEEEEEEDDDDDDDAFEEDAEGEDDEEPVPRKQRPQRRSASIARVRNEGEEDDEEEGVGAVKIKPGETDDEDISSEDSADSADLSDAESEGAAEWDGAENDDADDDESETSTGHCIFCKQDEDNDPAVEFEVFLACVKCGDNGRFPWILYSLHILTQCSSPTMRTGQSSHDKRGQ